MMSVCTSNNILARKYLKTSRVFLEQKLSQSAPLGTLALGKEITTHHAENEDTRSKTQLRS